MVENPAADLLRQIERLWVKPLSAPNSALYYNLIALPKHSIIVQRIFRSPHF